MLDWLNPLLNPTAPDGASAEPLSSDADPQLLRLLQQEMRDCESLYRTSAYLCGQMCPDRIDGDYPKFAEKMLDLHRGLIVKILVEIAAADRLWHAAEREVAVVVLQHVWGVNVGVNNLDQALQNISAHAQMLKWNELLEPFIEMPPLAEQLGDLGVKIMRIANLICKADGRITTDEARQLKQIQTAMENALMTRNLPPEDRRRQEAEFDVEGNTKQQIAIAKDGEEKTAAGSKSESAGTKRAPISAEDRFRMYEAAMNELDDLIGLDPVKKDIHELVNFLKIQKARQKHDLPATQVSLHTVFEGNPGTGKTTVARILSHIFCGLEILDRGHTIETDRSGLVAEYAGQTGPKTNQRVEESLDGVLFIDEAYSLVAEKGDDPFGNEAMQSLLKRMEDDRDRLVVIIAGYPEPMSRLLRSNPGLSSRFQRTFNFPDYDAKELLRIFYLMCKKNHYTLPKPTQRKLLTGFQHLIDRKDEHFGNARLARNIFEQSIRSMASRIVNIAPLTKEILTTLEPDDIQMDDVPFPAD